MPESFIMGSSHAYVTLLQREILSLSSKVVQICICKSVVDPWRMLPMIIILHTASQFCDLWHVQLSPLLLALPSLDFTFLWKCSFCKILKLWNVKLWPQSPHLFFFLPETKYPEFFSGFASHQPTHIFPTWFSFLVFCHLPFSGLGPATCSTQWPQCLCPSSFGYTYFDTLWL